MPMEMRLTTWGILAMFIIGLMFTMLHTSQTVQEAFEGRDRDAASASAKRCPNILIQKGSELYLHNSRIAKVPGVNPLKFNNLEEYVEFMNWQRSQGIRCPVLFLQHTFDAQGKPVYKIRPSPTDPKGGLPPVAAITPVIDTDRIEDADNPPMDATSYPPFDPMDPKAWSVNDEISNANARIKNRVSANPMKPNWGGNKYTESLIRSGKYAGNEVKLRV